MKRSRHWSDLPETEQKRLMAIAKDMSVAHRPMTWGELAKLHNIGRDVLRRALDPVYAAHRREQIATSATRPKPKAQHTHVRSRNKAGVQLPRIPGLDLPERRTLTGQIMNDPPPGKSALDQRNRGETVAPLPVEDESDDD